MTHLQLTSGGRTLDASGLLAWLASSSGATIAAPCVLHFETASRVFLRDVMLGPLSIELDTGRLGVALPDRVRDSPPKGAEFMVWLEGFWETGGLMPGERLVVTAVHKEQPQGAPGLRVLEIRT